MALANQRTYNVLRPAGTHFRVATCEEVGCPDYQRGWRTRVPASDGALLSTARTTGRRYVETADVADGVVEFIYEAGQPCFRASQHRVPTDAPAIHIVRDGRSDPRRMSAQGWHDDLGEHLDRIREAQERG